MKQIWKFPIPSEGNTVTMPKGAQVLSVEAQGLEIMAWAVVDLDAPLVQHHFPVYGTGHLIEAQDDVLPFIGTVLIDPWVWHIFDGGEA